MLIEKEKKKVKGKETEQSKVENWVGKKKSRNGKGKQSHIKNFSTNEKGRRVDKCDI